jgi:signal transduction histidine kinase
VPENHSELWARLPLRTKLTLLIEGLILVIVTLTGAITTVHERQALEGELRKRGLALAGDLAIFTVKPVLAEDVATLRRFANHTKSQDYVRYISILDPNRKVLMDTDLASIGTVREDALSRRAVSSLSAASDDLIADHNGESIYHIYSPIAVGEARLGTVLMGYSRNAADEGIAKARRQIITVGLLTAVLGGILASILAAYITTPIRQITAAMQVRSGGEVGTVPCFNREDEIGELAASFQRMTADLAKHRDYLEVLVEARTERLQESMDIHWMRQRFYEDQQPLSEKAQSMSKLIDSTVHAVRRISSELRPKLLDDLGLSAALEWQVQQFQDRTGISCDISSDPEDIVLDQAQTTAFFRIFQETLTNTTRHANASHVELVLKREDRSVKMTIRDNGRGITAEEAADGRSFGIVGMRERALSLGGELKIVGVPGQGTTVEVTIPI